MPIPQSISVERGRVRKNLLDGALLFPSTDLASINFLTDVSDTRYFLPTYTSAAQHADGKEFFAPSLTDDGTFTVYLQATVPANIAGDRNGAKPITAGTSFALVLNPSDAAASQIPLHVTTQGTNVQLSTKLAGDQLKRTRTALFDTNPNVSIRVIQPVKLAVLQSEAFLIANWTNPAIKQGIDNLFSVSFDDPSIFFGIVSSGDPDFPNQYLILNCVYEANVGVPPLPGYVQRQVNWNDRAYNYYQDNQDRTRVFYVPDSFEFAKGPDGSPTISLLQFSATTGSVSDTQATFRFFGNPLVDAARIQHAAESLKALVGTLPQMISLQDGHGVKMSFTQYLPNAEGTGSNLSIQPQAMINLATGLRCELALNFKQFSALWAAIFSTAPGNLVFVGWIDIELADGRYKDRVNFNGRLPANKNESFFDDILDTTTNNTYPLTFEIKTLPAIFAGPPSIHQLDVSFSNGKQVTLTTDQLSTDLSIQRSIRDIILGNQPPDALPYSVHVVHTDGSEACGNFMVPGNNPTLMILRSTIQKCTDPCS